MKIILSAIAIVFVFKASAIGANANNQFDGGLDTTVFAVATGGYWKQGENYGNIRVVVRNLGWEHTRSQFYIQWLQSNDSTKTVEASSTIPIAELNERNWININKIERIPSEHGARFKLYYQVRTKEKETIKILKVGGPSEYELLQP